MEYHFLNYEDLVRFCRSIFASYGFSASESADITDILTASVVEGSGNSSVGECLGRRTRDFIICLYRVVIRTCKESPHKLVSARTKSKAIACCTSS